MEEQIGEKKNNKIWLIILIVVLVLGVGCGAFLLGKYYSKKDNPPQPASRDVPTDNNIIEPDPETLTEQQLNERKYYDLRSSITLEELEREYPKDGTDLSIIKNEVNKLIAYVNSRIDNLNDGSACSLLNNYFPSISDINEGENILLKIEPEIMECMYGMEPTIVNDDDLSSVIITNDQYDLFNNYFKEVTKLDKLDNVKTGTQYKQYLNKDYYFAYNIGDGFGSPMISFEIANIVDMTDYYVVSLNAYVEEYIYDDMYGYNESDSTIVRTSMLADSGKIVYVKYNFKLVVEVVDGHLKYHTLTIDNL